MQYVWPSVHTYSSVTTRGRTVDMLRVRMCTFCRVANIHPYGGPDSAESATDTWLSIGEAAQLLSLSISTLRRYDDSGLLRAHRSPGGQRRYRRSEVLGAIRPAA